LIALQFKIYYSWIQNGIRFRCVIPNNRCYSWWYNSSGNVISRCYRLQPVYARKFTSSTCWTCAMFCPPSCAFGLCCWDNCWGVKNRLVECICGPPLSSYFAIIRWRGKYVVTGCWGLLLGTSIDSIPSVWERNCSCD
jgi:hypothetical protein